MSYYDYGVYMSGPSSPYTLIEVLDASNSTITLTKTSAVVTSSPNPSVWSYALPPAIAPTTATSENINVKIGSIVGGVIVYTNYQAVMELDLSANLTITCSQVCSVGQYAGWDNLSMNFTLANP